MPAPKQSTSSKSSREPAHGSRFWFPPDPSKFVNPWNNHTLLDYYLELLKAYGYIRLLGLPQLKDNPDIPIESLFVEPEFSEKPISADQPTSLWPQCFSLSKAIQENARLVVVGDPGAGKTSLLQWLVTRFCRSGASYLQEQMGALVPLPFVLRELPLTTDVTWDKLLEIFLAQPIARNLNIDRALLKELLKNGQVLVMLDGLDEVSSMDVKKALRTAIWEGILRHNRCRWIMTSRIVGYNDMPFHTLADKDTVEKSEIFASTEDLNWVSFALDADLGTLAQGNFWLVSSKLLYLAPFNNNQIEMLVRNWYAEREADSRKKDESIAGLLSAIRQHVGTEKLARIPNLLTMMALIHRVRARLPQGRVNLYGDIADAYLQTIDDFRGIREVGYSLAQKKQWLARIAFEMQLQRRKTDGDNEVDTRGILVDRQEVLQWLTPMVGESQIEPQESEAAKFLDYIQRRTGLFLERTNGKFAFLHLSFQEYFAACYLAEEVTSPLWLMQDFTQEGIRSIDLQGYAENALWKETLVFLFELLGQVRPRWADIVAEKVFTKALKKPFRAPHQAERKVFSWQEDSDVVLMSEVSVDSYSGLSNSFREKCWEVVWRCCFPEESWISSNTSANTLLGGAPQFIDGLWRALVRVDDTIVDGILHLGRCSDLTPKKWT